MKAEESDILVFGTGSIGGTVAAWLATAHDPAKLTVLDRPENAGVIRENGLIVHKKGKIAANLGLKTNVVTDVSEHPAPDIVIIAVKNYDLEAAAKEIKAKLRSHPLVIAIQDGAYNERLLRGYFKRVIYGVVCFNAEREAPNSFAYQARGPILFGILDDILKLDLESIVAHFKRCFPCGSTKRLLDAARCKIVVNLANCATALVGHGTRPIAKPLALKQVTVNLLWEGVQILQKAGVKEVPLGTLPSWKAIRKVATLPSLLTNGTYKKSIKRMLMSSMAQDLYLLRSGFTELDSINGYMVELADRVGFNARYNKAIYQIAKESFSLPDFTPIDENDLLTRVKALI
jgi:2-dehydropantoate 2-reductase